MFGFRCDWPLCQVAHSEGVMDSWYNESKIRWCEISTSETWNAELHTLGWLCTLDHMSCTSLKLQDGIWTQPGECWPCTFFISGSSTVSSRLMTRVARFWSSHCPYPCRLDQPCLNSVELLRRQCMHLKDTFANAVFAKILDSMYIIKWRSKCLWLI